MILRIPAAAVCAAALTLALTASSTIARDMRSGGGGGGGMGGGGGVSVGGGFGGGGGGISPAERNYDPRGGMGPMGYDPVNPYAPGFTIHGDPSAFGRAARQERKRGKGRKAKTAEGIYQRHLQDGQQNMQFLHNVLPVDW